MAKKKRAVTTIVRQAPPAPRASSGALVIREQVRSAARHYGGVAKRVALEEKHTLVALGAAAAAGYARKEGMLDNLPHVTVLGVEGTYGAVAWAIGRYGKSQVAAHVATGLLAIGLYRLTSGET